MTGREWIAGLGIAVLAIVAGVALFAVGLAAPVYLRPLPDWVAGKDVPILLGALGLVVGAINGALLMRQKRRSRAG